MVKEAGIMCKSNSSYTAFYEPLHNSYIYLEIGSISFLKIKLSLFFSYKNLTEKPASAARFGIEE